MPEQTPRTAPVRGAAPRGGGSRGAADISFDEQVQIMGQINQVLARNRIQIQPETFVYTPRRRGSPIPLLINIGALVVLAVGAFALFRYFNREEQDLVRPATAVLSAEAKLLQTFKRQSEQQLAERDQEISAIRGRLDDLAGETQRVRLESEAQIRRREVELKAELARQLEAERQRLRSAGTAAAGAEEQLRALEARLRAENQRRLEDYRSEAGVELARREQELLEREGQYRGQLQLLQQDRTSLEQQLRQQEQELEARRRSESAALESERSRAAQELTALTDLRDREQAALDQIVGSYARIGTAMRTRRYDAALSELGTLESFLGQEAVVALPAVQSRLGVERFVIGSLRTLIDKERAPAPAAGVEETRARALLNSVAAAAVEADRLARSGDAVGARAYYQSAVDQIPEVRRSHAYLIEQARQTLALESESSSEAARRLRSELEQARSSLRQQGQELTRARSASDRLGQELQRAQALLEQRSRRIAALEEAAQRQEARARQAGALHDRYASAPGPAAGAEAVTQAKILSLVDTKLRLREVAASEAVKSRYPGLAGELEDYFSVYGDAQERQGREEALQDALAVLEGLAGQGPAPSPSSLKARYGVSGDLFGRYLQRLSQILR